LEGAHGDHEPVGSFPITVEGLSEVGKQYSRVCSTNREIVVARPV
jgi:hypothetical protein